MYVVEDLNKEIVVLRADPASGALTQTSVVSVPELRSQADMLIDPSGRFLYAADVNGFQILAFAIQSSGDLKPIAGSNYTPRMSTGIELQVLLPIINAPFRIYYAYNPLILNTFVPGQSKITRDMFPAGGAGDYTFQQAVATFGSDYVLKEPRKTFRFTVSTTF